MDLINQFFSSSGFLPRGHCYLWMPSLVWLHAVSDLVVGAVYLAIPFTLVWFHRRRSDMPFPSIFVVFALFIFACGVGHLMDVWTLWVPGYWVLSGVKVVTAVLSLFAGYALIRVIPGVLSMPSPAVMRSEMLERRRVESLLQALNDDLEHRVQLRTTELEAANTELKREIAQRVNAESALRESEAQLRTLVEHAPEAIVVLDAGLGTFSLVNDNACRLFGLPREELLRRGPVELSAPIQPDGRPAPEAARGKVEAAIRGEAPVFEWLHRDAQGKDVLCEVRLVRLSWSGTPLVRGSIIDITERKRMEEALRKSEIQFATVFRTCPESVSFSLWDDGTCVDVNEAYERLYGYTRSEMIGISAARRNLWVDPDERTKLLARLEREGRVHGFEAEFRSKDGRLWTGEISADTVILDGRRALVAVVRDVTVQKQAAEALKTSEERFHSVFRSIADAVAISTEEGGTYLEVNPAHVRVFGYPREEIIGASSLELDIWADPNDRQRMLEEVRTCGRVTGMDTRFRRKGGEIRYCELSAEPIDWSGKRCLVVSLRDDTERVMAEDAMRRSEEKFSKVFRTCPETITIATLDDGTYLEVNEAFERLYGVPVDEAIGSSTLALGVWVEPERRNELVRQLKEHRRVTGFPNLIRHRSGEIRATEISAEVIDIDARPCLIAVVRDITERQRAEQEILRLNSELEQRIQRRTAELEVANRELESFSYSVSHDLRAPLRSIHGFSQALLEDCGGQINDEGRQHIDRIKAAASRMGHLIDDLLELARVTRIEMVRQRVDLSELARDIIGELRSTEPARKVEVLVQEGLEAMGDPRLLRVVLENLLGNAWKFTSRCAAACIQFGLVPGSAGLFRLQDNGAGFDMQFVGKLFGAFQRLHGVKEFPGTGVGLATVHRIIRRHGGRIWAEGAVDRGAVFFFTLGEVQEQA